MFFLCLRDLCYNVLNFVNFIGFSCMLMYFGHVENQDQNSPRKWADIFMTRGACPNFWSQSRKTAACPDDVCRSSSLGTTGLKIDSMASTSFIWRMVVKSCTSKSVGTMKHYIYREFDYNGINHQLRCRTSPTIHSRMDMMD